MKIGSGHAIDVLAALVKIGKAGGSGGRMSAMTSMDDEAKTLVGTVSSWRTIFCDSR